MAGKPRGERALTGAERTRFYRERLRQQQPATKPEPTPSSQELAALRKHVAALEQESAALKAPKAAQPVTNREPAPIDANTLPGSAQQKLEAAIWQHKKNLDRELERRVHEESAKLRAMWNEIHLPNYRKKLAEAERAIKARKGVMNRATFKIFLTCLHPDSRKSLSDERMGEAFRLLNDLEPVLVKEEAPTPSYGLPRTVEEMMEAGRKYHEARRARRAAGKP